MQKISSAVILSILFGGHIANAQCGNGRTCGIAQPVGNGRVINPVNPNENGLQGQGLGQASGTVGTGVFNPNGDPATRIVNFDQFNRPVSAVVLDASRNTIATTNRFTSNGDPIFDTNTGLSRNGMQRLSPVASGSAQLPSGTRLPDASLEQRTLSDGTQGWVQTRPGQTPQVIEAVTGNGTAFQNVNGLLTPVQAVPGDLIVRDAAGRAIMVNSTIASELLKKYQALSAEERTRMDAQRGGSTILVDSVVARQRQVLASTATADNRSPSSTSGSHNNPPAGGGSRTTDPTAPNAWDTFKTKFEAAKIPEGKTLDDYIKDKAEPEIDPNTAGFDLSCVSSLNKSVKEPMTLFLKRVKDPLTEKWISKIRLDAGKIELEKAELEKNQDRETLMANDTERASLHGNRKIFPVDIDYDLKTIQVDSSEPKIWVKVTAKVGNDKFDYLCGSLVPRKLANPVKPPEPGMVDPKSPKNGDLKEDAPEKDRTQISAKSAGAKLPALLGKCAKCHGADGSEKEAFSIRANSVSFPSDSSVADQLEMTKAVDLMVAKKLGGNATKEEVAELKFWLTTINK